MNSEITHNYVSVLFGKWLLWVEFVLLVVMIYFRILPLVIFIIFLTAMNLIVIGWKAKSLVKLTPSIQLSHSRVFAGEPIHLKANVSNNKLLPLPWLEYEIQGSPAMKWDHHQDGDYQTRLLWLMWNQSVSWDIELLPQQRGLYNLGNIVLRSGDGFRFTEDERQFHLEKYIYVWPKLLPVLTPSLSSAALWAMEGKNKGILDDPLLVDGIRDYHNGDEWRRINWQASARSGKLQSNVYQPVLLQTIQFFVDVQGFDAEEQRENFEMFISIIASLAVHYGNQGFKVIFSSNASTAVVSETVSILDEFAKLTSLCIGTLPLDVGKSATLLFYFCKQITMTHVQWFQHMDKATSVVFYRSTESPEQTLLEGSCAVKLMDELYTGGQPRRDGTS